MQTFFVVDSVNGLDEKINLILNNVGDNIKFFVKAKFYTTISQKTFVINNLAGIYKENEKAKIDEYLKSDKCNNIDNTILYYSSVDIDANVLQTIREKVSYNYDSIYVDIKRNVFQKIGKWIYEKFVYFMLRVKDACASPKLQFMSKKFMEYLQSTSFSNHILQVQHNSKIDVTNKNSTSTLMPKANFNKYIVYDFIVLIAILLAYVLLEAFFKLPFFAYFAVILGVIMTIVIAIIIVCFSKFNSRCKYRPNKNK